MSTITYTGRLVTTSCWCGICMAVPEDLYEFTRSRHGRVIYCPIGHKFTFTNTVDQQLAAARAEANAAQNRERAVRDLLAAEEHSHRATKGHVTRKKKELSRVKAGVCPCCNRTFQNLSRHMTGKHPDYKP